MLRIRPNPESRGSYLDHVHILFKLLAFDFIHHLTRGRAQGQNVLQRHASAEVGLLVLVYWRPEREQRRSAASS